MSDGQTPPPPTTLPETSRYRRRRPVRLVSWTTLVIGFMLGMGIGLFYARNINPIVEIGTRPNQLDAESKAEYLAVISMGFAYDSDLGKATERLIDVTGGRVNPFQAVADAACDLTRGGYADTSSGIRAIRAMKTLYQLQGVTGCADELILANSAPTREVAITLPTPTAPPPATKTPTQLPAATATSIQPTLAVQTSEPLQDYTIVSVTTYCDPQQSGLIEAYVQDFNGQGIPGEPVRVRWDSGEDTFFSGLKPDRGTAYADFQMEPGVAYTIEMPGRSEPYTQELLAGACTTEFGVRATTSYRIVFRAN